MTAGIEIHWVFPALQLLTVFTLVLVAVVLRLKMRGVDLLCWPLAQRGARWAAPLLRFDRRATLLLPWIRDERASLRSTSPDQVDIELPEARCAVRVRIARAWEQARGDEPTEALFSPLTSSSRSVFLLTARVELEDGAA